MNVPQVKGSHNAMKSGMLAAEAAFEAMNKSQNQSDTAGMGTRLIMTCHCCVFLSPYLLVIRAVSGHIRRQSERKLDVEGTYTGPQFPSFFPLPSWLVGWHAVHWGVQLVAERQGAMDA